MATYRGQARLVGACASVQKTVSRPPARTPARSPPRLPPAASELCNFFYAQTSGHEAGAKREYRPDERTVGWGAPASQSISIVLFGAIWADDGAALDLALVVRSPKGQARWRRRQWSLSAAADVDDNELAPVIENQFR